MRTYFSMEIIKPSKGTQIFENPLYRDHPQVQNKFSIKDDNDTEKLPQTKAWSSVQKFPPALKTASRTNQPIGS